MKLVYADYMRLVRPIFNLKTVECATVQSIQNLISIIQKVTNWAQELGYAWKNDERSLVIFIHGKMDETTKELWTWEVMDGTLPGLEQLEQFLKKRLEHMQSIQPLPYSQLDDWDIPSGSGISNPPRRAKVVCENCEGQHILCHCTGFRNSTLQAALYLPELVELNIFLLYDEDRKTSIIPGVMKVIIGIYEHDQN